MCGEFLSIDQISDFISATLENWIILIEDELRQLASRKIYGKPWMYQKGQRSYVQQRIYTFVKEGKWEDVAILTDGRQIGWKVLSLPERGWDTAINRSSNSQSGLKRWIKLRRLLLAARSRRDHAEQQTIEDLKKFEARVFACIDR